MVQADRRDAVTEHMMPEVSPGHHALRERALLYAAGQDQDQYDDQDQTETAAGAVTPVAAVAPGRQGADQCKNQNHDQNGRQHGCLAR